MPHVRSMTRAAIALSLASLAGCASWPGADHSRDFVIVRHAEKVPDGSDDPELTAAGRARAQAIADTLADTDVVAVYSTDTRRTRQTATPTAQAHGLPIIPYAGEEPAQALATRLLDAHSSGTVLVVGHSNTVPALAQALCGCAIDPIAESEYGRRITVRALPSGRVRVDDRREP